MKPLLFAPLVLVCTCFAGPPPDVPPVADAACPANTSQLVVGAPWAFQLRTGAVGEAEIKLIPSDHGASALVINPGIAAIGTFTAQPGGTLTATLTESVAGSISRRASAPGRYILYPDCSGGEIMIMLNGFAAQLEFVWTKGLTEMYFVSETLNPRLGGVAVLTGGAVRAPAACPASVGDPLNLISGTGWSYRLSQGYLYAPGDASVGTFRPFVSGGAGVLTATETSTTSTGLVSRLMRESGRYQIYADCSGGEIMLMNRAPGAVQMEFVFAGAGFDTMFLLNDNAARPADVPLTGEATRY